MSNCLVLCDGSLPGLVTLAIEAERADSALTVIAGDPSGVTPRAEIDTAHQAIRAQAEIYGASVIEGPFLIGSSLSDQSPTLLAAARASARLGIRRLVWGVQYPYHGSEPDLDAIATTVDRALLISRLASLDLWDDPDASVPEISIETPVVDLSDEQIADLAADLGVPWQTLWWIEAQSQFALDQRNRWAQVFSKIGIKPVTIAA